MTITQAPELRPLDPGVPAHNATVLRNVLVVLAPLLVLTGAQYVLSLQALGILVLASWLTVSVVHWCYFLSTAAPGLERFQQAGLGLVLTLSLISLTQLVLLLEHLGSNLATAVAAALVANAVPFVHTRKSLAQTKLRAPQLVLPPVLIKYAALVAFFVIGSVIIWRAMRLATTEQTPTLSFTLFWLGMIVALAPVIIDAIRSRRTSSPIFYCVLLALIVYTPVLLHSSGQIFNFDEFAHQGETRTILRTGQVFLRDAILPIGAHYPGFETLNASLVRLSGLSVSSVGIATVALCRIVCLLGIGYLAKAVTGGRPGAAMLAILTYSLSPQFLYFDALYSYETFALPLAVWLLVAIVEHARQAPGPWVLIIVILAAQSVITHHLSTYLTVGMLLVLWFIAAIRKSRAAAAEQDDPAPVPTDWRRLTTFSRPKPVQINPPVLLWTALLLGGGSILWAFINDANVIKYLGTFPRSAYTAFNGYLHGHGSLRHFLSGSRGQAAGSAGFNERAAATRGLFQGTLLPSYERVCSLLAQPVLLGMFGIGLWRAVKSRSRLAYGWAFIGFCYFLSLPLTLVGLASSGAHRTWAFSFIGIAVTIGFLSPPPQDHERTRHRSLGWARRLARIQPAQIALAAVCIAIVTVGNYASSVNLYNRFPGPYILGADGRDATADVKRSADWFAAHEGYGRPVVTTRRTMAIFGSDADAQTVPFYGWELFFPTSTPNGAVHDKLLAAGAQFVIVDHRLTTAYPIQSYFSVYEPAPPTIPLPAESLAKFDATPWLRSIHVDGNITIYQIVS